MRDKFFERLPKALHREIDTHLNSSESTCLASTSTYFKNISELPPIPLETRQSLKQFLNHVVHGEHQQVEEMLRDNIRLLIQRDAVTDCSGRTFASISGFEYALWALDKFQWEDMLACLPRDKAGLLTEEGQKIATQLHQQYVDVKTKGVTYRLNGVSKTETHYDFAITHALQEQVDAQTAPGEKNWQAIEKQWRERVGGAQRLCPMHVVDEYCSDTPFFPVPKFDSRPRPVHGLRQFYNLLSRPVAWATWFGLNSKLGFDFAINKGHLQIRACGSVLYAAWASHDFDAMMALCKTRDQDFTLLEVQLNFLLDIEEQPRPGGGI